MKVFLGGHGFLPYTYSWDGIIPENMKAELSQLIENDDEIMYFENTYGETPIKNYFDEIKYKNAFSYKAENGITPIVNKADYALISFGGYEKSYLQEIISFLYLGKKCKLYFPDEDKLMEVFELEDLTELVGEYEFITNKGVKKILEVCGFSDEMVKHLIESKSVNEGNLIEIIYGAPVSLSNKYEIIDRLRIMLNDKRLFLDFAIKCKKDNVKYEKMMKMLSNRQEIIKDTLCGKLEASGKERFSIGYDYDIYSLFEEWYDTDVFIEKSSNSGLYSSKTDAYRYIDNEENVLKEDEDYDGQSNHWYRLEAYEVEQGDYTDEYIHKNNYYVYNGEICWLEKLEPYEDESGNTYYRVVDDDRRRDLNLSTPYKTGDIVLIDCRPFGEPFHAVILEAYDQFDCCFPNIIFKVPHTDEYRCTSLKHKMFYKDAEVGFYCPRLSPLYRLRTVKQSEMTKEDDDLITIRTLISESEEVAKKVFKLWQCGDKSFEEVIEFVNEACS